MLRARIAPTRSVLPQEKGNNLRNRRRQRMAIKDLIPWSHRGRELSARRGEENHPFLTLHREMNRLFEDAFRGFDLLGPDRIFDRTTGGWPNIEVSETDREIKVLAELPGLEDKDVQVELANG